MSGRGVLGTGPGPRPGGPSNLESAEPQGPTGLGGHGGQGVLHGAHGPGVGSGGPPDPILKLLLLFIVVDASQIWRPQCKARNPATPALQSQY